MQRKEQLPAQTAHLHDLRRHPRAYHHIRPWILLPHPFHPFHRTRYLFYDYYRHYIDTESEESQKYFGELCVLVGNVYWVILVVYVLFGGELCQEKNLGLVHYGTVGKCWVLYPKDYLLGADDLIDKEVIDS